MLDRGSLIGKTPRPVPSAVSFLDFRTFGAILRRRSAMIATFVVVALALALAQILTTVPLYTAESDILIDTRSAFQFDNNPSGNAAGTLLSLGMDSANVDSQVEILKSERIATLVLRKLKLERDPEFTTPGSLAASVLARLKKMVSVSDAGPDDPNRIPREVMEEFLDRLDVKRSALTYVVSVSFRARSRERAALIANEIADAYLTDQLQAKYEATRRAGGWLQDRIRELRAAALSSDAKVQEFKAKNNIVSAGIGPGGGPRLLSEQQVGDMGVQLVNARTASAEAEAKYKRLRAIVAAGDPDAATADVLTSDIFNDLRQRYTATAKRIAEVAGRLGENHPAVQNLRDEMRNIRQLILDELKRAMEGYRSGAEIARTREASIAQSLAELSGEAASSNQVQVQLRELERDAATNKALYETFLERYKTSLQQESFPITDARILSEASPPRLKSHPKTILILVFGAIGGLAAGVATALLKEMSDGVFRTPRQLEAALDYPCIGVLPEITRPKSARRSRARAGLEGIPQDRQLPADIWPLRYAVDEPFTRFAETLRAIKVAADAASRVNDIKILSMVSAVPGEGKSTIAMNFAQLLAHSGKRVLLIDADLRSPTLSEAVVPGCQAGLGEVLAGTAALSDVILNDGVTGLHVLPAVKAASSHTSELISSERMKQLLSHAAASFDMVVVDLPPLVPIVDVRAIAPLIDAFVFVAQYGETPIVTAVNALAGAPTVSDRVLGTILNRANLKTLSRHVEAGDRTYAAMPAYRSYVTE